jgi:hypothetical protein
VAFRAVPGEIRPSVKSERATCDAGPSAQFSWSSNGLAGALEIEMILSLL